MSIEPDINETTDNPTLRQLQAARSDLLDLGLRNTLISYRTLKSRGVEVVDEVPAQVFRILVREGKSMSFEAKPNGGEGASDDLFAQPPDTPTGALAARHIDRKLQTDVSSAELQKRLLNSFYMARTLLEEQGVSVLFLALGMLEWYETDTAEQLRRGPLVLVPVELQRSHAMDRFRVVFTGEDIGDNLSLSEKLSIDFGIASPDFPLLDDFDLEAYFDSYKAAITSQSRWRVDRNALALGFFSFGKFLMYRDLNPETWPEEIDPIEHPIVKPLLGDGFMKSEPTYAEDVFIDDVIEPGEINQIVDADSTQTLAILEANAGRNLVIQGPPGTGKSQTITNIIAEAIGANKTVLFVSEKMAALEVVKRRLDGVGIGDACLELHSNKTNKRGVLNELERTVGLGKPVDNDSSVQMSLLDDSRDRLNAYAAVVNDPIGDTNTSVQQAYGRLLNLKADAPDLNWPKLEIDSLATWSQIDFERRAVIVEELQARVAAMGQPPNQHPYFGVRRTILLPSDQDQIYQLLSDLGPKLNEINQQASGLAATLDLPAAGSVNAVRQLVDATRSILDAPADRQVRLSADAWQERSAAIAELLAAGDRYREIRNEYDDVIIPEAWDQDLLELRQDLASYRDKWWRFLSGTFRSARSRFKGFCTEHAPASLDAQIQLVDAVMEAQRLKTTITTDADLGRSLFTSGWNGADSDWESLAEQARWALEIHQRVQDGELPQELLQVFDSPLETAGLAERASDLEQTLNLYSNQFRQLISVLEFDPLMSRSNAADLLTLPLVNQEQIIGAWSANVSNLNQIVGLNVSNMRCTEEGIAGVAKLAASWDAAGERLAAAFGIARNEALIERAMLEQAALRNFNQAEHETTIERFRNLDQLMLEYNRLRLAAAHWDRVPRHVGGGQLGTLRREFEKKSRHLPIRRLMEQCGNAIQAIKPVFMMSPMSIATYISPGSVEFDLVIFDEASQVRPVDALGALLRGRQAIVVGDSKQLPPTSFFDTLVQSDELLEDEPATSDIESVLGLFSAQNALQRMLRWHYRSRHESLIAVSNYEFYENRLVVFPSPDAGRAGTGLTFRHLPQAAYDRGKSRTNPDEARAVAEAVFAHARNTPQLTLGVAAFSTAQTRAILDQVELLRRENGDCEAFFNNFPYEPFFVKNLENVQGDERDVMLISVGYGRDLNGHLTMNFGPLNREGGERRLNVLITRARRRCTVFTNLTSDDIDLNRTNARGVAALKRFLSYAESGDLQIPETTGRPMDSPFEEAVHDALTRSGYVVEPQVGTAGYFIDLAIVDNEQPGRYLLGIECDGATYHSARSARDRDRLRQQVLEGLGWTIHRIWSTDWFRNPDRELPRVIEAIERAKAGRPPATSQPTVSNVSEIAREDLPAALDGDTEPVNPYVQAVLHVRPDAPDIHEINIRRLSDQIVEVVAVESPVHLHEVARRIIEAHGVERLGTRIRQAIGKAAEYARREGRIQRRGEFLWSPDMQTPPVRDRANLNGFAKSIESIALEEIEAAVQTAVANSFGMERTELAVAAGRILGYQRVTTGIRTRIEFIIDNMLANADLAETGSFVTLEM